MHAARVRQSGLICPLTVAGSVTAMSVGLPTHLSCWAAGWGRRITSMVSVSVNSGNCPTQKTSGLDRPCGVASAQFALARRGVGRDGDLERDGLGEHGAGEPR